MWGLGFGVWSLGSGVLCLGSGVWGLRLRISEIGYFDFLNANGARNSKCIYRFEVCFLCVFAILAVR